MVKRHHLGALAAAYRRRTVDSSAGAILLLLAGSGCGGEAFTTTSAGQLDSATDAETNEAAVPSVDVSNPMADSVLDVTSMPDAPSPPPDVRPPPSDALADIALDVTSMSDAPSPPPDVHSPPVDAAPDTATDADHGDGSPSPTTKIVCQANATPTGDVGSNPDVSAVVTGANGSFVDHCDLQGNLVNYSCETALLCSAPPNPRCTSYETGNVIATALNCAGHCSGGACDGRCPMQGDKLSYISVDPSGAAVIQNVTQNRRYVCTVYFTGQGFNCSTIPKPGAPAQVYSIGFPSPYCTGANFGNIGVSLNLTAPTENCGYACSISP